eukprot:9485831-Pyramimonas_sp.AAC.1
MLSGGSIRRRWAKGGGAYTKFCSSPRGTFPEVIDSKVTPAPLCATGHARECYRTGTGVFAPECYREHNCCLHGTTPRIEKR